MKSALFLSLFISFSAFAETCYVRNAELITNEVSLAREICIGNIDINLNHFGKSAALIHYTLDGVSKTKSIDLVRPIERRDGNIMFGVYYFESNGVGGFCGDTTEASTFGWLVLDANGKNPRIEEIKGEVTFSNDNCHSDGRVIQTVKYEAR